MLAFTQSCGISGIEGYAVTVEVNLAHGMPMFEIVGLPDASVKESRERVRAALKNSGYAFPSERLTVNLAPADQKKEVTDADVLRFVEAAKQNKRLSAWLDTVWLEMASKNFEKYVGIISADGEIDTHAQQRDPDQFFAFFSQDTQSELFEMEENQS